MVTIRIDNKVFKIKDGDFIQIQKLEKELLYCRDNDKRLELENLMKEELQKIKSTHVEQNYLIYQYDLVDRSILLDEAYNEFKDLHNENEEISLLEFISYVKKNFKLLRK